MSQVPDLDTRINLIMRLTPYLPLLLALSTSSPFWQGHLTGLCGYRLAAYDELPRTGLPELFRTKRRLRRICRGAGLGQDHSGRELYLVGVAALAAKSDHRVARRRQLHAARRRASRSRPCSAAWCARSTATARSTPVSTGSAAPSRKRTSGMPSAMASPPPSSIRSPARRSRSGNGSTKCSTSSPTMSTRSAALPTSSTCDAIVAERHQRRPPDRHLHQGQGRGPQKVNGDRRRDRLGGCRDPGVRPNAALSLIRRPGFPLASGPPIKRGPPATCLAQQR